MVWWQLLLAWHNLFWMHFISYLLKRSFTSFIMLNEGWCPCSWNVIFIFFFLAVIYLTILNAWDIIINSLVCFLTTGADLWWLWSLNGCVFLIVIRFCCLFLHILQQTFEWICKFLYFMSLCTISGLIKTVACFQDDFFLQYYTYMDIYS